MSLTNNAVPRLLAALIDGGDLSKPARVFHCVRDSAVAVSDADLNGSGRMDCCSASVDAAEAKKRMVPASLHSYSHSSILHWQASLTPLIIIEVHVQDVGETFSECVIKLRESSVAAAFGCSQQVKQFGLRLFLRSTRASCECRCDRRLTSLSRSAILPSSALSTAVPFIFYFFILIYLLLFYCY